MQSEHDRANAQTVRHSSVSKRSIFLVGRKSATVRPRRSFDVLRERGKVKTRATLAAFAIVISRKPDGESSSAAFMISRLSFNYFASWRREFYILQARNKKLPE